MTTGRRTHRSRNDPVATSVCDSVIMHLSSSALRQMPAGPSMVYGAFSELESALYDRRFQDEVCLILEPHCRVIQITAKISDLICRIFKI